MNELVGLVNDGSASFWVAVIAVGLVLLGATVWYAAALSALFERRGSQGWRAWVPFVGEAEVLRLGGVPGWSVAYYLIPVVGLWGAILRVRAVHRITVSFGRGVPMTLVGMFAPPVWAGLLGWSRQAAAVGPVAAPAGAVERVSPPLASPPVERPSPPPVAQVGRDVPPSAPLPVERPSPPPVAPVRRDVPPSAPLPVERPSPPPVAQVGRHSLPPVAPDVPVSAPPPAPAPPAPAPPPVEVEAGHDLDDTTVVGLLGDQEWEGTVVVDRPDQTSWWLFLEDGRRFRLEGRDVVVGRRPVVEDDSATTLAIPDQTRTLSKQHARLYWRDGWFVTDLGSTNGVVVLDGDVEREVPLGSTAPVRGRMRLGSVEVELRELSEGDT